MFALRFLATATLISLATTAIADIPGTCLIDPVTTYTNGMPLASSTSLRSHKYNYQCDANRMGWCDGRWHGPLRASNASTYHVIAQKFHRKHGQHCDLNYLSPDDEASHAFDGLEGPGAQSLGHIPAPLGGALSAAAPDAAVPAGGAAPTVAPTLLNELINPAATF
jgi:hypothetical protein